MCDMASLLVMIPHLHRTGVKSEGEWGGADVDGDLLDGVDVASPVGVDTGGVNLFRAGVGCLQ